MNENEPQIPRDADKKDQPPEFLSPKEKLDKKEKTGRGALFIPAGLFLGFGFGFINDNIPAGTFIGLGIGFLVFAISLFSRR